MICPSCKTENRDERTECYHCSADLMLLRTAVIASRHLFNRALDHAGRGRTAEAMEDLRSALELDASFARAWVVLGTLLAREERFGEAEEAWRRAIRTNDACEKAHNYLVETGAIRAGFPAFERLRSVTMALLAALAVAVGALAWVIPSAPGGYGRAVALLLLGLPLAGALLVRLWPGLRTVRSALEDLARGLARK